MKNKLTKPATLGFMFMVILQGLYAQDYLITFSGSGQSTTVETVEVKNIAQQTTLTLSGTDTLLLADIVGTGFLPKMKQGIVIYPNPTANSSRLEFYNSSSGNTRVEIYDFSGRLVIQKSFQLDAGSHAFAISGLKAGIYLVKVNTPEHIYSQRQISTSVQGLTPELQYEGITQIRPQEPDLKSISNVVAMQYNEGERLVIKAISGDYAHTKSLVPTESQNIDFEFMDCIDGDGNQYGVAMIGEQVWMAENLKTQKDTAGNSITRYCYDDNITNCQLYGGLYTWLTVMNGAGSSNNNPSGVQGICPAGWHVPSKAEWTQLVDYVVAQGFPNSNVTNGAGNALKSCRQVNSPQGGDCNTSIHPRWNEDGSHYGFDEFGFSGLPAGKRFSFGVFDGMGGECKWWSSTEGLEESAWNRDLGGHYGTILELDYHMHTGASVRCLRNSDAPSAAFTAEPTIGTVPLTVNFTDQSFYDITSWQWTFGDGGSSTQQNPVHIYQNAGHYTVQLTVTNSYGSDTEIKTDYIIVTSGGIGEPCPGVPTVSDIDGNVYNTVLIGVQCWMKENLKTTTYSNGNAIPNVTDANAWGSLTTGAYAWYGNDINWKDSYGALYNWHAVSNTNGLCPTGWHVPSDAEWTQLVDYVVAQGFPNELDNPNGAGNALKSCRQVSSPLGGDCNTTEHPRWESNSTHYGFDEFGFSGLPGGIRDYNGDFGNVGYNGNCWSSTEYGTDYAWARNLDYYFGNVGSGYGDKTFGFSVRCLKD